MPIQSDIERKLQLVKQVKAYSADVAKDYEEYAAILKQARRQVHYLQVHLNFYNERLPEDLQIHL